MLFFMDDEECAFPITYPNQPSSLLILAFYLSLSSLQNHISKKKKITNPSLPTQIRNFAHRYRTRRPALLSTKQKEGNAYALGRELYV